MALEPLACLECPYEEGPEEEDTGGDGLEPELLSEEGAERGPSSLSEDR
jgi:hypothetical protein